MRLTERPDWARRIVAERAARQWSQQDLVSVLRRLTDFPLPSDESMLRSLKGWEAGQHRPSEKYQRLIAQAFDTVTLAIFGGRPLPPGPRAEDADAGELLIRIRTSDLDSNALDAVKQQVDKLCVDYSWADANDLLDQALLWLDHLNQVRSTRTTLAEHQRILELAGWLSLLIGTVCFDLADLPGAERARRTAVALGRELQNRELEAWGHELSAWFSLTDQRWERVLPVAQAGRTIAEHRGVGAQLAIQEAEALARLGARQEADTALASAQTILEQLPAPANPLHHFNVEHDKFDKALMRIHLIQGDDRRADMLSTELEHRFTNSDGTLSKPMRVADARTVRAVVAARQGDLDHALDLAHAAFDIERRTVPTLIKHTTELAAFLEENHPADEGAREFLLRRSRLAESTTTPHTAGATE